MATSTMSEVIRHLRRKVILREGAGLTDGQLLEEYISHRDEAALAALVRRHAPMVWGVCRRVLRNHHDAEDASQATFLVLVRRASSITSRDLLANWLYGVAHQTAMKARATAAKRKGRERQVAEMPEPAVAEQDLWHDLQPLLDEELSRLPNKSRAVIVLCDLQGRTRREVAGQLGVPEGTVAGWLARAREMLAKRLARRGVALSGGTLAAVLSQHVASASVPPTVVLSTIKTASLFAAGRAAATGAISFEVAALTEGVLKTMFMTKLKTASVVLALAVALAGGVAGLTAPLAPAARAAPVPKKEADPAKLELARLQGTWRRVGGEHCGEKFRAEDLKKAGAVWEIKGEQVTWRNATDKDGFQTALKINPSKKPKEIDLGPIHIKGKPQANPLGNPYADRSSLGIYELKGDTLRVCYGAGGVDGKQRPKEFKTRLRGDPERFPDPHEVIFIFERVKGKEPGK
jgi:RNA polymerase sigma factor (sigma-70 family)